jgi:hypothetical protein
MKKTNVWFMAWICLITVQGFAQELPPIFANTPEEIAPASTLAVFPEKTFLENLILLPESLKDVGVSTANQEKMIAANGSVKKVFKLDCGHSAYFAKPVELAEILRGL